MDHVETGRGGGGYIRHFNMRRLQLLGDFLVEASSALQSYSLPYKERRKARRYFPSASDRSIAIYGDCWLR